MTIPPPPEAVRQYFDRRRRPRDPDRGLSLEELTFDDGLWRAIWLGKPVPGADDLTPASNREALPDKLPGRAPPRHTEC